MDFNLLKNDFLSKNILASILLIIIIFAFRSLINKSVRSSELRIDLKRKWLIYTRTFSTLIFFLGIFIIWFQEVQSFALSLVAIAAAIVIATKELILAALGGLYRAIVRPYKVGDRIEIDHFRGDVIDSHFLSTSLLEIGPGIYTHQYTGRSISFPNSKLLTHSVINESFMNRYVLHVFKIPVPINIDVEAHEKIILEIAHDVCSPFLKDAKRYINDLGKKEGLETPTVDPRVTIHMHDYEEMNLIVRVPSPTFTKGRVEQAILKEYLKKVYR